MALSAALVPAAVLTAAVCHFCPPALPLKPDPGLVPLGRFLVGPYALAFELISVVLLAAMIGAVLLGFERRKRP